MKLWRYAFLGTVAVVVLGVSGVWRSASMASSSQSVVAARAAMPLPDTPVANTLTAAGPMASLGLGGKPLRGYRICVDPGHGGQSARTPAYTGGTFGKSTRQTESDVNLRVGLMLAQLLEEAGADVVLTRTTDNRVQDEPTMGPELDARSRYANRKGADLFISVHHNDGPGSVNYTGVFYYRGSDKSVPLADSISASLAFCLGTPSIGARSSAYRVLKDLRMPGVIVECSFLTNTSEDGRLANLAYNKLQAKGIAIGIMNYVRQTRGRSIDFTSAFGPYDVLGHKMQTVADATYRGAGAPPTAPARMEVPVQYDEGRAMAAATSSDNGSFTPEPPPAPVGAGSSAPVVVASAASESRSSTPYNVSRSSSSSSASSKSSKKSTSKPTSAASAKSNKSSTKSSTSAKASSAKSTKPAAKSTASNKSSSASKPASSSSASKAKASVSYSRKSR